MLLQPRPCGARPPHWRPATLKSPGAPLSGALQRLRFLQLHQHPFAAPACRPHHRSRRQLSDAARQTGITPGVQQPAFPALTPSRGSPAAAHRLATTPSSSSSLSASWQQRSGCKPGGLAAAWAWRGRGDSGGADGGAGNWDVPRPASGPRLVVNDPTTPTTHAQAPHPGPPHHPSSRSPDGVPAAATQLPVLPAGGGLDDPSAAPHGFSAAAPSPPALHQSAYSTSDDGAAAVAAAAAPAHPARTAAAAATAAPSPHPHECALQHAGEKLSQASASLQGLEQQQQQQQQGRQPSQWQAPLWRCLRAAAATGVGGAALVLSHAFGIRVQWSASLVAAALLAAVLRRRGALAPSGAAAVAAVGAVTLCSSLRMGATVIAFFFICSGLPRLKAWLERCQPKQDGPRVEAGHVRPTSGPWDWRQVLSNGLAPALLAIAYGFLAGCVDGPLGALPNLELWRTQALTALMGAFMGYYACCCGMACASELGPLSSDEPVLITSRRPVPKGTDGGVTHLGLSAAMVGGLCVGVAFCLAGVVSPTLWVFECRQAAALRQGLYIAPLAMLAGLVGSAVASLLGATLQYSGWDSVAGKMTSQAGPGVGRVSGTARLSHNQVTLASASITAALTALVAVKLFGF